MAMIDWAELWPRRDGEFPAQAQVVAWARGGAAAHARRPCLGLFSQMGRTVSTGPRAPTRNRAAESSGARKKMGRKERLRAKGNWAAVDFFQAGPNE
jgi:transcription elongation factor